MKVCPECYSVYGRITPLLNPEDCLRNHRQYICSTCGRHICAAVDESGRFRALFPMRSLAIAKLYLRSAEVIFQRPCGIYEIESKNGRKLYKIFSSVDELDSYLKKNKDKTCTTRQPLFEIVRYKGCHSSQLRMISAEEVDTYMNERRNESQEWRDFE